MGFSQSCPHRRRHPHPTPPHPTPPHPTPPHPTPHIPLHLQQVGALHEPVLERPQARLAHTEALVAAEPAGPGAGRQEGREVVGARTRLVGGLVV
jgi:hypothetical protein